MSKIYAYIRVSTDLQTTDNQRATISKAGYKVDSWISEEGVSGTTSAMERVEFARMISMLEASDIVIVTAVDRLGRNAGDILNTISAFKRLKVSLVVLQFGNLDITSTMGKMVISVMAAMAEMERDMISERTKAGMARTKAQGTKLGRALAVKPEVYKMLYEAKIKGSTMDKMAEASGVARNTISRILIKWGDRFAEYEAEYNRGVQQYAHKKM